jgi:hypothetical protein
MTNSGRNLILAQRSPDFKPKRLKYPFEGFPTKVCAKCYEELPKAVFHPSIKPDGDGVSEECIFCKPDPNLDRATLNKQKRRIFVWQRKRMEVKDDKT